MVVSTGQRVAVRAHHNDETIWFTWPMSVATHPLLLGWRMAHSRTTTQGIRDAGAKTAHAAHTAQASQARAGNSVGIQVRCGQQQLEDSFAERVAQLNDAVELRTSVPRYAPPWRRLLIASPHAQAARMAMAQSAVNVLHAGDGPLPPLLLGESVRKAETAAAEEEGRRRWRRRWRGHGRL